MKPLYIDRLITNPIRFHVFYWQYGNRLFVADRFGEVDYISRVDGATYFCRIRPLSKMPKTLIYLGPI